MERKKFDEMLQENNTEMKSMTQSLVKLENRKQSGWR